MDNVSGKWALVTGASSGFGVEFATLLGERKANLILAARGTEPRAVPGYAAYAASKGYVLLFGEALHAELKPYGIGVTVLSPGTTSTSFGRVAGERNTAALRALKMKPGPVARTGILAMLHRRSSVV